MQYITTDIIWFTVRGTEDEIQSIYEFLGEIPVIAGRFWPGEFNAGFSKEDAARLNTWLKTQL